MRCRAQARDLYRRSGILLDRTERLANSLGHLAGVVSRLSELAAPVKVSQPGASVIALPHACYAERKHLPQCNATSYSEEAVACVVGAFCWPEVHRPLVPAAPERLLC